MEGFCKASHYSVTSFSFAHAVAPYNAVITTQITGTDVIYTCTAEGGPFNTFEWTRSSDNSQVSTSPMFTLDGADPANYDTYTCTIQNSAGNNSTMITLDGKKNWLFNYINIAIAIANFDCI